MREELKTAIRDALVADGWTYDPLIPSATLAVETRAGGRTAIANMAIAGSIYWDYYSEGRNALATSTTFIPQDASVAQVRRLVTRALVHVRQQIDNTYARSLYLRYPDGVAMPERKELLDSIRAKLAQGQMMVIPEEDYIWFVRPDGEVRWMYAEIDPNPNNRRYWPSTVGTIVAHVLAKAEVLTADDPRIIKYEATFPGLGDWLKI